MSALMVSTVNGRTRWGNEADAIINANPAFVILRSRDKYSNSTEIFKRPKIRDDSSDLDENLTESIAEKKLSFEKVFRTTRLQKTWIQSLFRVICCLNI